MSGTQTVLECVQSVLASVRETSYSMEDVWDRASGIYHVVCSQFVRHVLDEAVPERMGTLRAATRTTRPSVKTLHRYFSSCPVGYYNEDGWKRIDDLQGIKPGDVLAVLYQEDATATGSTATGHVMIATGRSALTLVNGKITATLTVADSSRSPHGAKDTRGLLGGVGDGTIVLQLAYGSGHYLAWKWSERSSSWREFEDLVVARPLQE
jgi:hypothetical protein